jgi:hypothetical protein
MKRLIVMLYQVLVFVFILAIFFRQDAYSEEIILKAGTPVPIRLEETVTSESCTVGQTVRFTVTRHVSVRDIIAIKAGSPVEGEIVHAEETGSLGKEGEISMAVRYATAVDGTRIPLRSQLSAHGDERVALSWMVCPFIKGTKCQINAGTETKAYVDFDTKINVY